MTERDRSPIDQRWLQDQCDVLLRTAQMMPEGVMKDALLKRAEITLDILEAWQRRGEPR